MPLGEEVSCGEMNLLRVLAALSLAACAGASSVTQGAGEGSSQERNLVIAAIRALPIDSLCRESRCRGIAIGTDVRRTHVDKPGLSMDTVRIAPLRWNDITASAGATARVVRMTDALVVHGADGMLGVTASVGVLGTGDGNERAVLVVLRPPRLSELAFSVELRRSGGLWVVTRVVNVETYGN